MREILFRAKRQGDGKWVYGDLQHDYDGTPRCISDYCGGNPVDPATVGQYTGQKDKNGKRIFEGDVVKITDRYGKSLNWTIEFRNCEFACKHPRCNYWWSAGDLKGYTREVIGNIHDNPEYLSGEVTS